MRLPFKANDETTEEYIAVIKELCIIQHEDTWYKDKSHAVLYPDLEDAKKKVGIIYAKINLEEVVKARKAIPTLSSKKDYLTNF